MPMASMPDRHWRRLSELTGVKVSAATIKRLMTPDPQKLPRQIRQVYTSAILELMSRDAEDYHKT